MHRHCNRRERGKEKWFGMTEEDRTSTLTQWETLSVAADLGHLYLDADVARRCDNACIAYIEALNLRIEEASTLAEIHMYGSFKAGRKLSEILSKKAVGDENSMVEVLKSHIQVVEKMQIVFRKFFVDYDDTEGGNASQVAQSVPK